MRSSISTHHNGIICWYPTLICFMIGIDSIKILIWGFQNRECEPQYNLLTHTPHQRLLILTGAHFTYRWFWHRSVALIYVNIVNESIIKLAWYKHVIQIFITRLMSYWKLHFLMAKIKNFPAVNGLRHHLLKKKVYGNLPEP